MNDPDLILSRFREHYADAVTKHSTITVWDDAKTALANVVDKLGDATTIVDVDIRDAEVGRRLAQLGGVCLRIISELDLPVPVPTPSPASPTSDSASSASTRTTAGDSPPDPNLVTVKGQPPPDMLPKNEPPTPAASAADTN